MAVAEGETLNAEELARRVDVPEPFLKQILVQLRDAGVVRSVRGPAGGYRLNHAAEEITLEKIVRLFQGPLAPISCATRSEPEPCAMEVDCSLRSVWAEVRNTTIAILERTTFAGLAARAGGRWVPVELAEPARRPS